MTRAQQPRRWTRLRAAARAWRDAAEPTSPDAVAQAYQRLGRSLIGTKRMNRLDPDRQGTEAAVAELIATVARLRALGVFGTSVEQGLDLDAALVAGVRALTEHDRPHRATGLAVGVGQLSGGADAGRIGLGLAVRGAGFPAGAWAHFGQVPTALLAAHVPTEAVECALLEGSEAARARALEISEYAEHLSLSDLVTVATMYYAVGARDQARRLSERANDLATADGAAVPAEAAAVEQLARLERWLANDLISGTRHSDISFGVLGPHRPDQAGDAAASETHLHALGVLGQFARFDQVTWNGDEGLVDLVGDLGRAVPAEHRLATPPVSASVIPISRDFSVGESVPACTWVIAAGSHVDRVAGVRYAFPYHPQVRPVFVSFHLGAHEVLDEETVAYLRRYGPIGCRDWTTVGMLLSVGVDAFFTGSIDATLGSLGSLGAIGSSEPARQEAPDARALSATTLSQGVRAASAVVQGYRDRATPLATTDLGAYLSAAAVGASVEFQPTNPSDIRYDGLLGLSAADPRLGEMAQQIAALVSTVVGEILRGRSEEEVYASWRDLTRERVEQARAWWREPIEWRDADHASAAGLAEAVGIVQGRREDFGPAVPDSSEVSEIALSVDANLQEILPVTIESLVSNASGPIRLWITTRDVSADYRAWLAAAHPQVPITFLDFTGIEYAKVARLFRHITVTTMDRLILPEVLPEVDRLTYVDIDTVTEGDICELASTRLGEHPVAGKNPDGRVGFYVWRDAGNLLDPERASELRRWMSARQSVMFPTLNAGVMVLNLALMRRERFVADFLPLAFRFGLNDQDIINGYAGPRRLELDPKWNAIPRQEVIRAPGIVHYAGGSKPWSKELVPYGDAWKVWHQRAARRVGSPPSGGVI